MIHSGYSHAEYGDCDLYSPDRSPPGTITALKLCYLRSMTKKLRHAATSQLDWRYKMSLLRLSKQNKHNREGSL